MCARRKQKRQEVALYAVAAVWSESHDERRPKQCTCMGASFSLCTRPPHPACPLLHNTCLTTTPYRIAPGTTPAHFPPNRLSSLPAVQTGCPYQQQHPRLRRPPHHPPSPHPPPCSSLAAAPKRHQRPEGSHGRPRRPSVVGNEHSSSSSSPPMSRRPRRRRRRMPAPCC